LACRDAEIERLKRYARMIRRWARERGLDEEGDWQPGALPDREKAELWDYGYAAAEKDAIGDGVHVTPNPHR